LSVVDLVGELGDILENVLVQNGGQKRTVGDGEPCSGVTVKQRRDDVREANLATTYNVL
jgi:hypothetical protein